ncbi:MAG: VOC family protein [Planctomycetota bacterium]|jgi:catechol 2,3-dioxygenase-like lactoylglutathione lyase family enzyme|nr:VOC family protein [Deltaproteobacteria bacterium]
MATATGVHHAAFCTSDIRAQIRFFSEVVGMRLVALYWMHGVEGAMHAFLSLGERCSLAFVQLPQVAEIAAVPGVSHAANAGEPVAGGALQHLALNVDGEQELLAMRDRIRSAGIQVLGPVDHGFCKSIYLAGLEGMLLEFSTSESAIDPKLWIDPEVVDLCGIGTDELERYVSPHPWSPPDEPVPQPAFDRAKPHQRFPPGMAEWVQEASDEEFAARMSETNPPGTGATTGSSR